MTFLENVDKTKLQKITLIVISALVLAALALLLVIIIMSITPKTPGLSDGIKNLKDYTVTDTDINTGSLILADDDHHYTLDKNSVELVNCQAHRNAYLLQNGVTQAEIDDRTGDQAARFRKLRYMPYADMYLQKDAMVAAHEMLIAATDANMDKYGPITIDTAYGLTTHLKGHSQEIGTALTIYLSDENSDTGAYKALPQGHRDWFDKNAYKYGFIESFEDGYRYVGAPHAKLIKDNDDISTLADYIAFLKDKTGYDKTVRVKVDGVEYAVYYVACEEGQTIKVPANNTYTISGTNEGGVIITVKLSK